MRMKRNLFTLVILLVSLAGHAQLSGLTRVEALPALVDADGQEIGHVMVKADETIDVSGRFVDVDERVTLLELMLTARTDVENPHVLLAFAHVEKPTWWMMPATRYNGQDGNCDLQVVDGKPVRQLGIYSYQRMSILGAGYTEGIKNAVGTWTDEPCSSSVFVASDAALHCLAWPEQDNPIGSRPWMIGDSLFTPKANIALKRGEQKVLRMYICAIPAEPDRAAMGHFLRSVWKHAKGTKHSTPSGERPWESDKSALKTALDSLDQLLLQDWKSLEPRDLSDMAVGLFRASKLVARHPEYCEVALDISRHLIEEQYGDGVWGQEGGYYVPVLLSAYEATRDETFLQAALKGYDPYMKEMRVGKISSRATGDCWWWGRVERDSAYPLLQAALWLHRLMGEASYLTDAVLVSNFLSTWLWHYGEGAV